MADTTISQLPVGTPTANAMFPFSQNGTTYSTVLSSLDTNRFFVKANCTGIATANMPNAQSKNSTGNTGKNLLPLNTIVTNGTNPYWNSSLNVANSSITIPEYGFYMATVQIEGYVPVNPLFNMPGFYITLYNGTGVQIPTALTTYQSFLGFHCHCVPSQAAAAITSFCFNPTASFWANAGANVRVQYQMFTENGPSQAMYSPIYNTASLSIIKLN